MSDMYNKVSRPAERPKRRRGAAVFIALAAAVVLIAVWILSAYGILSVRRQFYQFVSAISDSTVYAYENDSLRAEMDGQSIRVTGGNNYSLYHAISVMEPDGRLLHVPEGEADIVLDYGDGAVLRLWKVKGEDGKPKDRGLELVFDAPDGKRFLFSCKNESLSPLERWAGLAGNGPWED